MIRRRFVTSALTTMLASATKFSITALEAPDPLPDTKPYGIVEPITGSGFPDEPMDGSYPTMMTPYQVTCVGGNYAQTEALMDLVTSVMLSAATYPLSVTDGVITRCDHDVGPTTPDKTPGKDEWVISTRYSLFIAAN